ncbi:Uma2 family endonuclease [Phormidium tenue]|uniref:Uma2 family endonuclease n=1 Tax=Phormidium tenue TaxID=126344 RepID=UPI001F55A813
MTGSNLACCKSQKMYVAHLSDNLKVTQAKMQEYQDNGARLGWLINRKDREVEVYRIEKPKEVLQNPSSLSGEDVLPEFVLSLAEIW